VPTHVALLRAVNVGGRNRVPMSELRELCRGLGHDRVATYLQSGNVVFDASGTAAKVARALETAITEELGLEISVIVRSPTQLTRVLERNPFLARRGAARAVDAKHLSVCFLGARVPAARVGALGTSFAGDELVLSGSQLYLHCPNGLGHTLLTSAFLEPKLGTVMTNRNWNTVHRLADLAASDR
jgi:uncharacterized protein (DUF1697 family)